LLPRLLPSCCSDWWEPPEAAATSAMTISALDPYKSRYIPPPHTKEQRRNSNEDLNHSNTDGKITARKKLIIFINYYRTLSLRYKQRSKGNIRESKRPF
jgi:hypothetical protein